MRNESTLIPGEFRQKRLDIRGGVVKEMNGTIAESGIHSAVMFAADAIRQRKKFPRRKIAVEFQKTSCGSTLYCLSKKMKQLF